MINGSATYWRALKEMAISAAAPPTASPTAALITACVGIATAAGTAIWAVTKFLAERRAARTQATSLAAQQLQQRRAEELRTRQQLAAELIKAVGEAKDPAARRWTMSALSLYPEETLNLLLNSLGEAGPEDAAAIKLAVISIGAEALPSVVRAHRIAVQICATGGPIVEPEDQAVGQEGVGLAGASRVRSSTREIIINLLFQLDEGERGSVDLADVDLTRFNLSLARLGQTCFRKAHLDKTVFTRAVLKGAILRGATIDGAILTRANLRRADLTGASGSVHAVRADFSESILDQANLSHSTLDAVRLKGASLRQTNLDHASLAGAALSGAELDRTRMRNVSAHHLSGGALRVSGADLSHSDLADAKIAGSRFENARLVRIAAARMKADRSIFINSNFGGAQLLRSSFVGAELTGCNFGGANFAGSSLLRVTFRSCAFSSTDFSSAGLVGSRFDSCGFAGMINFTGVDLTGIIFEHCNFRNGAMLTVDNDSWKNAQLDPEAYAAFEVSGAS